MRENTYCYKCNDLIIFIISENGADMPCDATRVEFIEDPTGPDKVYLGDRRPAFGHVLTSAAEGSVKAYRPHWPVCPGASEIKREYAQRRPVRPANMYEKVAKGKAETKHVVKGQPLQPAVELRSANEEADWEQLSLFPKLRPRIQDAFDA